MYAGPDRRSFAFFLDVLAAISDERPGMAIGHHVGPEVAAIGAANRDGAAEAIEAPRFAGDLTFAMRARKCSVAACPAGHPSAHSWPDSGASIPHSR